MGLLGRIIKSLFKQGTNTTKLQTKYAGSLIKNLNGKPPTLDVLLHASPSQLDSLYKNSLKNANKINNTSRLISQVKRKYPKGIDITDNVTISNDASKSKKPLLLGGAVLLGSAGIVTHKRRK